MADGLLILLVLLNAYIIALFLLHQRGKLRGPALELVGPLLMWRTEVGKKFIDVVSRPKRLWKAYGDVGVAMTMVAAVFTLFLLLIQLWLLFTRRDVIRAAAPSPEYYLVLPGINPLIPVWYGLLGLVVSLVVHEGAHGVLARAHQLKVKSLGLLFFIVPIGAFVEPDDEELERAPTRVKNRVFAAGVMTNLAVALVGAMVFSAAWGAVSPARDGLGVSAVVPGQGAEAAGIAPGMILTALDGRPVRNLDDFNATLSQKNAGETVAVSLWHRGQALERQALLTDKYAYYEATAPALNQEEFRGRAFLGVSTFPMAALGEVVRVNANPLAYGVGGVVLYVSEPFPVFGGSGLSPVPQAFADMLAVQGPWAAFGADAFWIVVNSAYWIFWLNLMVGTFNALPLGPLDGGQMYKASLRGMLRRYFGVHRDKLVVERPLGRQVIVRGSDSATQEKVERIDGIVRRTTLATGLVILALILLPILGPRIL